MGKISFDGHLIETHPIGRGVILNGFIQHATATGISFDGYLMASTVFSQPFVKITVIIYTD